MNIEIWEWFVLIRLREYFSTDSGFGLKPFPKGKTSHHDLYIYSIGR